MSFHNPYNFLPTPARADLPDGLGDGPPAGHHRWHADRLSGEITVTMTAVTPLLLLGPGTTVDGHRYAEVATTVDADGRTVVDLAPTQIKGMLRTIYEALTQSRLSVFAHDKPLGYRTDVADAATAKPVVIRPDGRVAELGPLTANGCTGSAAVIVPAWQEKDERPIDPLLDGYANGDEVDAVVEYDTDGRCWVAVSLHAPGTAPAAGRYVVRGSLHVTGPSIKNKLAERLFVTDVVAGSMTQKPPVAYLPDKSERLVRGLCALIEHQRAVHRHAGRDEVWEPDKLPWEYRGSEPGRTAWSRHLYDVAGTGHTPPHWVGPDLAVPPPAGRVFTCWIHDGRLRPVMVSRQRYATAPNDLLDASAHPAASLNELSPADRLFGWTWTKSDRTEDRPEPSAHRGQLRVLRVVAPPADDAVEDLGELTLPPLAAPKPSQGRFYLAPRDAKKRPPRGQLFSRNDHQLRGRKVYPHQPGLEHLDIAELRQHFTYVPPRDPESGRARPDRDTQNMTLHSWVRPQAVFRFVLQITDAHPLELGALLWLLDPLRAGTEDRPARHRIGQGKPLGFGSVELSVESTNLTTGTQIRDRLTMLMPAPDPTDVTDLADRFETAMAARHPHVLEHVRAALAGFPAGDVSYPRMKQRRSPGYAWFVESESKSDLRRWLPRLGERLPEYGTKP